jgi:hypothetical protein
VTCRGERFQVTGGSRLEIRVAAGVVDQDVDALRQIRQRPLHRVRVCGVEGNRQH